MANRQFETATKAKSRIRRMADREAGSIPYTPDGGSGQQFETPTPGGGSIPISQGRIGTAVPVGSWQFGTPTKKEDQSRIRRMADRDGSNGRQYRTYFVFLPGNLAIMESTRQKKVARLVQKELAEIIMHHGAELAPGKMISVTTVRVSPDLSLAKTWVSVFPSEGSASTLDVLRNSVPRLRYELGQKIRNQLRIVPEIAFFVDDSNDYIDNISKLLKE